jgi:hypothetical protein
MEVRGPCDECEHVRAGVSTARGVFDAVLSVFQHTVRETEIAKLQEEGQAQGEFVSERESLRQLGLTTWSRRPTVPGLRYCGVDEFDGTFHCCEVKNLDQVCAQFTPRHSDPTPHACGTCEHNLKPSVQVVRVLEQTMQQVVGDGFKGNQFLQQKVRPALELQANAEYRDCVDLVGSLRSRPGFLPHCVARSGVDSHSGEPRYLVGPVVNSAARCDRWTARIRTEHADLHAQLDMQVERARQLYVSWDDGERWMSEPQTQSAASASGDVLAFCLAALGASNELIPSICSDYTRTVWHQEWVPTAATPDDRNTDPEGADSPAPTTWAPPISSAAAAVPGSEPTNSEPPATAMPIGTTLTQVVPSPPFRVLPAVAYTHPLRPQIRLGAFTDPVQSIAVVEILGAAGEVEVQAPYDLQYLQPHVWTLLQVDFGPLPIMIYLHPSAGLYAAWY